MKRGKLVSRAVRFLVEEIEPRKLSAGIPIGGAIPPLTFAAAKALFCLELRGVIRRKDVGPLLDILFGVGA